MSHLIQMLVEGEGGGGCTLRLNDQHYALVPDKSLTLSFRRQFATEPAESVEELKRLVSFKIISKIRKSIEKRFWNFQVGGIYAYMNVDEHQLKVERALVAELEAAQDALRPLEEVGWLYGWNTL